MPYGYEYTKKQLEQLKRGETAPSPDPTSHGTQFGLVRSWFQRNYGWAQWPPYPKPWGYPVLTEFDVELIAWSRKCQQRWYQDAQTEDTSNFTDWAHFYRNTALNTLTWPKAPETTIDIMARIFHPLLPYQKTVFSGFVCYLGFLPPWHSLRMTLLDDGIIGKLWRPLYNKTSSRNPFFWQKFTDARTTFTPSAYRDVFSSLKLNKILPNPATITPILTPSTSTSGSGSRSTIKFPFAPEAWKTPVETTSTVTIKKQPNISLHTRIFPQNFARVSSCSTGLIIYTIWSLLYI